MKAFRRMTALSMGLLFLFATPHLRAAPKGIIETVAGGGPIPAGSVGTPVDVALDEDGGVLIADEFDHAVLKADAAGRIAVVAGGNGAGFSGDGGSATQAQLNHPQGVDSDGAGGFYIADRDNNRIRRVDASGIITTVAGSGEIGLFHGGFSGEVGPAAQAQLKYPCGVTSDGAGGYFIADTYNFRIRRVDKNGIIKTVAGDGSQGASGDGGSALQSQLNFPRQAAPDGAGGFYIADTQNNRIRHVDANGIIATVAGGGNPADGQGDGGLAVAAYLSIPGGVVSDGAGGFLIADTYNNRIRRVDAQGIISTIAGNGGWGFSGDGGPADEARIDTPTGIASDGAGGYLIADSSNYRIRRVSAEGTISTFAGNGGYGFSGDGGSALQAQLNDPGGAAPDGAGGFLIADSGNNRIRRVDADGEITTFAGGGTPSDGLGDGGPAVQARLNYPRDISPDGAGGFYIADSYNHRIRRVDANGIITTVAGGYFYGFSGDGELAVNAKLNTPYGVSSDGAGGYYIADSHNDRIRHVGADGIIQTVAGDGEYGSGGDDGLAVHAQFYGPYAAIPDGTGGFYIADSYNDRVRHVDASGIIRTVAGGGSPSDGFGDGGPAIQARLYQPTGLASDGAGGFFIADQWNNRIRHVNANGIISTVAGGGDKGWVNGIFSGDGGSAQQARLYTPQGVALSGDRLLIADTGNHRIREVSVTGVASNHPPVASDQTVEAEEYGRIDIALSVQDADGDALTYQITQPTHGALQGEAPNLTYAPYPRFVGQDSFRYVVSDAVSSDIATVTISVAAKTPSDGMIVTVAGEGEPGFAGDDGIATMALLDAPFGVTYYTTNSFLIADTLNNRIRVTNAVGEIWTIAGDGTRGFSGDGGEAYRAQLAAPYRAIPFGYGDILIADTFNHRIRQVDLYDNITTVAGDGTPSDGLGDGGSAIQAQLSYPRDISPDGAGGFYIADDGHDRIRRVDANGIITTVAGNGGEGFSGDGGLAVNAQLNYPVSVTSDGAGGFLIADSHNHRIRRVNAGGIIATVAGGGAPPDGIGDGGLAVNAQLNYPCGVSSDGSGGFLIADTNDDRIRWVNSGGIITTVAGGGTPSDGLGDGDLAVNARLNRPYDVSPDGSGGFYIADTNHYRIRRALYANLIGGLKSHAAYGDLNGDGSVTTSDVALLLEFLLGLKTPSASQLLSGDVRPKPGHSRDFGDGTIGADDLNAVLRASVGLLNLP